MWEVEPRLYWKVKLNGKYTWRAARVITTTGRSAVVARLDFEEVSK